MDKQISLYLYNLTKKNNTLNCISNCVTNISSKFFFIVYSMTCIFIYIQQHGKIINFILSPLLLLITNNLLRIVFKRPRPNTYLNYNNCKQSFSFPSNHSACSSVIASVCFFINPGFGILMLICSFITGLSRVMCGLHYLFDVLAGWLIGIIFAVVGFMYF